jgi:tetratricopeptide (TPR) repeat protein
MALACSLWTTSCTHVPREDSASSDQGIKKFDRSLEPHAELAKKYQASGDLAAAAVQWQILTLIAPHEAAFSRELEATRAAIDEASDRAYQEGQTALRKGEVDPAARAMLRVLALKPDHAEAAQALRDIERHRMGRIGGERVARARHPEEVYAARPAPPPRAPEMRQSYNLEQPIELFIGGNTAAGLREMRQYVEANPNDSTGRQRISAVVYERAQQLDEKGKAEDALALYQQAASLRGEVPAAWAARISALRKSLANQFYEQGMRTYRSDVSLAVKHWETCLRYDPQHVNAALRLRDARVYQERLERIEREKPPR